MTGYVYCGYCGNRGHNRLGCPSRRQAAQRDPEGYVARELRHEAANRRLAIESRTCSYCHTPGHNRRGCPTLKNDKVLIQKRQKEYVHEFFEDCCSAGFGPGTLVRMSHGDKAENRWEKEVLALVTEFNWDQVDFLNGDLDLEHHWQLRRRPIAQARIVSAKGWTGEEPSWNAAPKYNDHINVSFGDLCWLLPSLIKSKAPAGWGMVKMCELVGPAKGTISFAPNPPLVTRTLNDRFNLSPDKRAKNYEKSRLDDADPAWLRVNPEAFQKRHGLSE